MKRDILSVSKNKEISGRFVNPKSIVAFFVIAIVFMVFLIFTMIHLGLPLDHQLEIVFTFAIMVFAGLEGASTYLQVQLADRRYLIEDARNELEKAYGPLYTLLNRPPDWDSEEALGLREEDKNALDEIIGKYPFMFPTEIYNSWRKQIQPLTGIGGYYTILFSFKDRINEEYDRRVKRYNELLKKK